MSLLIGGRPDTAWAMSKENIEVVRGIYEAVGVRNDVTPFEVDAEDIEAAGLSGVDPAQRWPSQPQPSHRFRPRS